ncbi:MAG: ABC transporter ATP-binding protein [Candidatus Hydrogenedentes bacterium]|nr:ABC transporter ATP-binding protein [Candidatus Hydrogenedentota bacterium]
MANPGPNTGALAPPARKPKGSAWSVYSRLLGYAWQYKYKLMTSLVFAVLIVGSMTTMLLSVRFGIQLTFYEPPVAEAGAPITADADPRDSMAGHIGEFLARPVVAPVLGWVDRQLGWRLGDFDQTFVAWVNHARADQMSALVVWCVLLVSLSLLSGIARFIQEYFAGSIGARISVDLADEMYRNLVRQPVGYFEANSSGDIMGRFTNDVFMVNRGLAAVLEKVMREPLVAAALLGMALYTDVVLTLVGLLGFPPVALVLTMIGRKVRKSVGRSLQKIASMATVVNETITGIAIIKSYNMEEYEVERVRTELHKLRKFLFQMVRLNAMTGPSTEFILICGIVAFLLISGQRLASGDLDAGKLTSLFLALAMMLDPVRKLSVVNNMIQTSVASAERVFEIIDLKSSIEVAENAVELGPLRESIRFEDVGFQYNDEKEILKRVNVVVKKGEMIALVGPSGAGKSTLVKLLPRFYDVTSGAIAIDGHDLRAVTPESLRNQIGMVTQDTVLFAESIRDNIAFGNPHFTEEQVRAAAMDANAAEFIDILPRKFETVLGESGISLSGGQRQRLAIARALIKDPSILILDEATSSLDAESERLIQDALERFVKGRTVFVIAHRLSTIQRADRILVMRGGCIVEEGTHANLLQRGGLYSQLYATQFGAAEPVE